MTSILLIFVCAGLVAYGVHEFEEAFYTKDEMKQMEIWDVNDKGPVLKELFYLVQRSRNQSLAQQ